jgi:hypothetical protein
MQWAGSSHIRCGLPERKKCNRGHERSGWGIQVVWPRECEDPRQRKSRPASSSTHKDFIFGAREVARRREVEFDGYANFFGNWATK